MATTTFKVTPEESGERIDRIIAARLGVSNRDGKRIVERGDATVEGERVWKASDSVGAGATVRVEWEEQSDASALVDLSDAVLFRDEVMLAINKPAGLPTHATHDPARDHAHAAVQRLLGPDGYVGIHHRLDVETSGVLVFAIDRVANKGLANAFSQRLAKKEYFALCPAIAGDVRGRKWTVEDHLADDKSSNVVRSRSVNSGGKRALTAFEILESGPELALVRARPSTGRMHQIRVHLAEGDRPIVGDANYGGAMTVVGRRVGRTMLHARRLELPHPVTRKTVLIDASLPEDFRVLSQAAGCRFDAD